MSSGPSPSHCFAMGPSLSPLRGARVCGSAQRLLDVCYEVIGMLDTDGEADEGVGHPARRTLDRLAVLGQALHAARRGRRQDDLEPGAHLDRIGGAALDQKREHAAKAIRHLPFRDVMAPMRGKAWIENPLDFRMLLEMPRDAERVGG